MEVQLIPNPEAPKRVPVVDGWVQLPVYRGITEAEGILDIAFKHGAVVCGGYVRYCASPLKSPHPASDVDLFPTSKDISDALLGEFISLGFTVKHENDMSYTLKAPDQLPYSTWSTVQIIKPVLQGRIVSVGTLEEILSNFDFTIVRVGFLSKTEVLADAMFEADETSHRFRIRNIHCPISSTLRVAKYAKKGYYCPPSEVLRLFNDWDDRGDEYKGHIWDLFLKSNGEMSQGDVEELERLLWVD